MKHSICYLCYNKWSDNGFFCKIPYKGKLLKTLIVCNHSINEEVITLNDIKISFNNQKYTLELHGGTDRIIYSSKEYDVTFIEIKDEDNLKFVQFLELDDFLLEERYPLLKYKSSVYIPHYYLGGSGVCVSYGLIHSISGDDNILRIIINTAPNSSSPILNVNNNKVVGIKLGKSKFSEFNIGRPLKQPIIEFNRDKNIIKKYKDYTDKDFEKLSLISNGCYGDIYSAYSIKDKKDICLKMIDLEKMKMNYEQNGIKNYTNDLANEINILKCFSFLKNSVEYLGSYDKDNKKILVIEKCDNNLKNFLKEKGKSLTIKEIKTKFKELNYLFEYMQKEKIIHRDLKLENFLVKYNDSNKNDYIIKLSDYGISKINSFQNGSFSGFKGTIETIAPEIILEKIKNYDSSNDIFSLGIILYQLSHNLKHPFGYSECFSPIQYFEFIKKYMENYDSDNIMIEFDKSLEDNDFKDLIKNMVKLNPKNRITWEKYFSHPFFK